jgi:glycerophosphoryl diester phosphodiesterase
MVIIGHRGAAGLAPENTIAGIDEAIDAGVDGIEFDIQLTRDNHFVLMHDVSLYRITGNTAHVGDLTLRQINITSTKSGHPIPSLTEALSHIQQHKADIPIYLDIKGRNWAKPLNKVLKNYPKANLALTTKNTKELFKFKAINPKVETFLSEPTKPLSAVYTADNLGFSGITLNFWILNPLSYLYAKRCRLKIMVYTVNRSFIARFLHFFYPKASIITNSPDKLAKLSKRRTKK